MRSFLYARRCLHTPPPPPGNQQASQPVRKLGHVTVLINSENSIDDILRTNVETTWTPNWGPGRYSDRSLFRQVDIPTGRYSDRSIFRQTGRYSDRSLFREVDIPTNSSLFRQVVIPTGR